MATTTALIGLAILPAASAHAASVPFLSQAPFGEWGDPRQSQGCEEAASLMAVAWARGQTSISPYTGWRNITTMSKWEKQRWGYFQDTSIQDTADRLISRYLGYNNILVRNDISPGDIMNALANGDIVITAVNGRKINSPYYRRPGPLHHMLVVTRFNQATDMFVVNDPGTIHGPGLQIPRETLKQALQNYPSGDSTSLMTLPPAMIIIHRIISQPGA